MKQDSFRCIIRGRGTEWEGLCLDLDIAVHGASQDEVEKSLRDAVISYVDDAMQESPENRARLLNRRSPWLVRAKLSLSLALHTLKAGRPDRDEKTQSSFDLACHA
ncbi:hypothetical protein [Bosea sp. 685]|uniref:hypothetical protein n=1 Tax=Bosea sp. 685 TaxID=3080057 RepID=UPI002892DFCD|nr:hypothetical protein [Bosea sp. 685]WNJ88741.1 hypothetical protein RMR04_20285 [Bosea sp. 685]